MRTEAVFLLLLLATPALAFHGMGPGPGVKGHAAVGSTVLVGAPTLTAVAYVDGMSSGGSHYDEFTAVASGSIAHGYAALSSMDESTTCKMLVYSSSGVILATSAASSIPTTPGDVEFTFSSGSITASSTYYLGTVCDYFVSRGDDDTGYRSGHEPGTFASPANIVTPNATGAPRGNLRIWVTD